MSLQVHQFSCLSDNYGFLLHDPASGETTCIDTPDAGEYLRQAEAKGWQITQIWNTHWHPDHTGGNAEIKDATGCKITGPEAESARIPTLDRMVKEGDTVTLGEVEAEVIDVPAHTAGHIAYFLPGENAAFVGDTLFAMGCGRLFEGTAEQMFSNMRKLEKLPDATRVYCAHEYTEANGRYAVTAEPGNEALAQRMAEVIDMRGRGEPTVPTTIALEKATNPFMRAASPEELAERRAAKDAF
jgi:hydroxyacylglutathione hydrolase